MDQPQGPGSVHPYAAKGKCLCTQLASKRAFHGLQQLSMEGLIHSLLLNPAKPRDRSSACLVGTRDGQGDAGKAGESRRAEPT